MAYDWEGARAGRMRRIRLVGLLALWLLAVIATSWLFG